MAHGQNVIDFLELLKKHPEGLTLIEAGKQIPSIEKNSGGIYGLIKKGYIEQIKAADGSRKKTFKITEKGCELIEHYKKNPDDILKKRTYKKRVKLIEIQPQLYHDPIAQQYIEAMARPVAWSSSLGSALRDIYLQTQKILDTEDIPQGSSDLDKHNKTTFALIEKIHVLSNREGI